MVYDQCYDEKVSFIVEEILGKGILHSHWNILERLFLQGSLQGNRQKL